MYHGWKNYETWAVNLWLTNNEGAYIYWSENAKQCRDVYELAKRIQGDLMNDAADLTRTYGLFFDLLQSSLNEVDFMSIADHFMTEDEPIDEIS